MQPSAVTQTEFANIIGTEKSYINKLKDTGRLVFDENGKIMVEESKQLIAATKDPSKQGVADRHQQERQEKQSAASEFDEVTSRAGGAYQQARAMKEKYAAMQAKIAYEKEVGELLEIQPTKLAVMDGDVIIRNRLEAMPDVLAPQLAAENDEQKIRIILIDQIEYLLGELSQTFKKMTRG